MSKYLDRMFLQPYRSEIEEAIGLLWCILGSILLLQDSTFFGWACIIKGLADFYTSTYTAVVQAKRERRKEERANETNPS